jgi:hypothetical protein
MTRFLLPIILFAILLSIISCSKEKELLPPDNQKINLIQTHTWILDSTNTITATYNVMQQEVPSSSYTFSTDTMTNNFHSMYVIKYGILYEAPNKVYFWLPGETKNPDEYIIIDSINDHNLIAKEIDVIGGRTRIRFCHAQ